jgi:hypothetical protein
VPLGCLMRLYIAYTRSKRLEAEKAQHVPRTGHNMHNTFLNKMELPFLAHIEYDTISYSKIKILAADISPTINYSLLADSLDRVYSDSRRKHHRASPTDRHHRHHS